MNFLIFCNQWTIKMSLAVIIDVSLFKLFFLVAGQIKDALKINY